MTEPIAPNPLRRGLVEDRTTDACAVVIFGASGDLTRRKLVPALYNLAVGTLGFPGAFAVVGVARGEGGRGVPRRDEDRGRSVLAAASPSTRPCGPISSAGISYVPGHVRGPEDLRTPGRPPREARPERGTAKNRLFYLAVASGRPRHDRKGAPGRPGLSSRRGNLDRRRLDPRRLREAVRPRPRERQEAERRRRRGVRRVASLPHRPLPRQRRRSRTCSCSASRTASSSRCGTASTSTTCRSPWPRTSGSRGAGSSTSRRGSRATSSRTT
jgi:hypothetical protein